MNIQELYAMKKSFFLFGVIFLTLLGTLPSLAQQRAKGLLGDKRFTFALSPLEKVHLYGSQKQEEVAKIRKLTDADILCVYEGQTIDSIQNSGWEWYRAYHFYKDGSLARYAEGSEDYFLEIFISGSRIVSLIKRENREEERCQVRYIPIGGNTYLLQMVTMQGEKINSELNGSKVTFDNKGRIIAIAYTYDEGKSYGAISKFRYDQFGNARNEQGQLCIPMLNDRHLDICTKLVLRSSVAFDTPYSEGFVYGMDVDSDSMSNITLFIKDFEPREEARDNNN